MITYITKDDSSVVDDAFAHFVIKDIHYVACFDVGDNTSVQRIPWALFSAKMKNNNATWMTPHNATQGQASLNANRDEFLRYICHYDNDNTHNGESFITENENHRDKSLVDVELERKMRKDRWR